MIPEGKRLSLRGTFKIVNPRLSDLLLRGDCSEASIKGL